MATNEYKNNRIGIVASAGIHLAVFLILFFMVAWRAPNPPLPEYGIELNFGLDDQGSGEVQPTTAVGEDSEKPAEETKSQGAEEQLAEENPDVKEKVNEVSDQPAEKALNKTESQILVKEEKKEVKKEVVKEKKEEAKEKVVAAYKKDEKKDVTSGETVKKGDPGNQGDDVNKTGDKGSPEGKLDAKALYGTPGGGGGGIGMDLQMSGWAWADQPAIPELPDNENGKVIFEIECDESGDITGITTLERSLSPKAEQILKEEIRKNSLVRTSGGHIPERSKGKIVFILKTK